MTKHLKKDYPSLCDAEDAYGVDYFEMPPVTSTPQTPKHSQRQDQPLSPIFGHSPSVKAHLEGNVCVGDIVVKLVVLFKTAMTKQMQLQLITYLLKVFIENTYELNFLHFIHGDIIEKVISEIMKKKVQTRLDAKKRICQFLLSVIFFHILCQFNTELKP